MTIDNANGNLDNAINYWDKVSSALPFDLKDHWIDELGNPLDSFLFEEVANYIFKLLPLDLSQPKVLEVGCGTGRIIKNMSQLLPNARIVGIDFSNAQISAAQKHNPGSEFYCKDISQFSQYMRENQINERFDCIFVHSVTQYFPSDAYFLDFLQVAKDLLNKGGTLLLIDVPIDWYKSFMVATSGNSFRSLAKSIIPSPILNWIKSRKTVLERFGEIDIEITPFQGYWVDPSKVESFGKKYFANYNMTYQPFKSKPVTYKRFRPIFILEGKI